MELRRCAIKRWDPCGDMDRRLTLYDPGGGAFRGGSFKSSPIPIFCPYAYNFGATLLCVGDFSPKIV